MPTATLVATALIAPAIWAMSTSQTALTAHLVRRQLAVDDMELLHRAKAHLAALGIDHATLQLEPLPTPPA